MCVLSSKVPDPVRHTSITFVAFLCHDTFVGREKTDPNNRVMMACGIANAMSTMLAVRYKCKDDNAKLLLPNPYEPWNAPTDPKYKEATDKAYRSFKMFENVKEWNFMSMPIMWVFAIFGGDLPYMTQGKMDGIILVSGVTYAVATHMFSSGYVQLPEKRLTGFYLRRRVCEFWLVGSLISLVWFSLGYVGIIKKDGWMQV